MKKINKSPIKKIPSSPPQLPKLQLQSFGPPLQLHQSQQSQQS